MNFRPDHHLHDLALELAHAGVADDEVSQHLAGCSVCTDRLAAIAGLQDEFAALPTPAFLQEDAPSDPAPLPQAANRSGHRAWPVLALVLAAAAAALFVRPTAVETIQEPEGWRSKGADFEFEIYVHDGEGSRRAGPGEHVGPGDRLGFSILPRRAGFVLVAGIDAADDPYLCFPQGSPDEARWFEASKDYLPLEDAVRLDDSPGTERIVALLCDESVAYHEVAASLAAAPKEGPLPRLLPGCAQQEHALTKELP